MDRIVLIQIEFTGHLPQKALPCKTKETENNGFDRLVLPVPPNSVQMFCFLSNSVINPQKSSFTAVPLPNMSL